MSELNIGIIQNDVRACFCVGKVLGCHCGGRCRCECSCTDLKFKDNPLAKSWGKALEDYRNGGERNES